MGTRRRRAPAVAAGFLAVASVGGFGTTLFWSAGFVVWACICVAAGVLTEVWLRRRERSRGLDPSDRPVLLRPAEWSVITVVMAALVGADQTAFAIGVSVTLIAFPTAWRDRRRARASDQGHGDVAP